MFYCNVCEKETKALHGCSANQLSLKLDDKQAIYKIGVKKTVHGSYVKINGKVLLVT